MIREERNISPKPHTHTHTLHRTRSNDTMPSFDLPSSLLHFLLLTLVVRIQMQSILAAEPANPPQLFTQAPPSPPTQNTDRPQLSPFPPLSRLLLPAAVRPSPRPHSHPSPSSDSLAPSPPPLMSSHLRPERNSSRRPGAPPPPDAVCLPAARLGFF